MASTLLHAQHDLPRLGELYLNRDPDSKTYGMGMSDNANASIGTDASWGPASMIWRGEEKIEAQRFGRARYLMSRILEEHPNTSHATVARLNQGMIALKGRSYGKARIYFDEAIIKGMADGTPEGEQIAGTALYMIAYTQAVEGEQRVETTVALLEELLREYPNHPREADALYMLGEIAEIKGQYERALEYYDRIARIHGAEQRFDARNHRAQCLAHLGRYQEAQEELGDIQHDLDSLWAIQEPVWNQDEMHADCMLLRGELEIVLGNYAAAEYAFVRLMNGGVLYRRKGLLGLADTYQSAGRNDSALAIYTRLIAEDSSDAVHQRAEFNRGLALRGLGQGAEAIGIFESIGRDTLHLMNDRALVELALIRYREQNYPAAIQVLDRAIVTAKDDQTRIRAYVIRGVAELGGGEPSKAIESFDAAEKLSARVKSYKGPELAEAKLLGGITLARTNRSSEAIIALNRFIEQYPAHTARDEAMFWLGESYYQSGLYKASADIMEDLIEQFPGSNRVPDAMYTTGWANFRQRRFDVADAAFSQLVKAYPSSRYVAEAQLRRGDAFYMAKRYDDAIRAYRQIEKLNPTPEESIHAAYQEALASLQLGQLDVADTLFQSFSNCHTSIPLAEDALYRRAEIAARQEDYRRAASLLTTLIGRSGQGNLLPLAYEGLGDAHLKLGNLRMAAGAYSIALNRFPKSSIVQGAQQNIDNILRSRGERDEPTGGAGRCGESGTYLGLGRARIYQETYQPDEALREYRELGEQVGEGSCRGEIWLGLAESHIAAGRTPQALDTLRLLLERYPDSPVMADALLALGRAHLMKGDTAGAITWLEQGRMNHPDSSGTIEARGRLADLYAARGERDTARTILRENIGRFPGNLQAQWSWLALARIDTAADYRDTIRAALTQLGERGDTLGAEALFAAARFDAQSGRVEESITLLEGVASRYKGDIRLRNRALMAIGESYQRLGATARAKEAYERILQRFCDEKLRKQAEEHLQALSKL